MVLSRAVRRTRAALLILLTVMSASVMLADIVSTHAACAIKHHTCSESVLVAPCCCGHATDASHPARPAESRPVSSAVPIAPVLDAPVSLPDVPPAVLVSPLRAPTHGYHATDLPVLFSTLLI